MFNVGTQPVLIADGSKTKEGTKVIVGAHPNNNDVIFLAPSVNDLGSGNYIAVNPAAIIPMTVKGQLYAAAASGTHRIGVIEGVSTEVAPSAGNPPSTVTNSVTISKPTDANGFVQIDLMTDSVGLVKATQLPTSPTAAGNLKTAVEEYLNGTLHKNLAKALGVAVSAGGNILSAPVSMPFDGTAIIAIFVSAATNINAVINGTSVQVYSFGAAGYALIQLELASGDTLQLTSSAAATITATVGARV